MKLLSERLAHIYAERPELEGDRGQIGFAKASGASKSVVNQWLADKIKSIDIKYALGIEAELGFSHIWLMTGDGDPVVTGRPHVVLAARDNSEEILRLLTIYTRASKGVREDIMRAIDTITGDDAEDASAISN